MPYGTLDVSDIPELVKMLEYIDEQPGRGVLTAGNIIPGVLTIHDVGHRKHVLRTETEARHLGFGYFKADGWNFSGGGSMYRSASKNFSWSPLYSDAGESVETIGYDIEAARQGLVDTIARLKGDSRDE